MIEAYITPVRSVGLTSITYGDTELISNETTTVKGDSAGLELSLYDETNAGLLRIPVLNLQVDNTGRRFQRGQGVFASGNAARIELRDGTDTVWTGEVSQLITELGSQTTKIKARHDIDRLDTAEAPAGDGLTATAIADYVDSICANVLPGYVSTTLALGDWYAPAKPQKASSALGRIFSAKRVGLIRDENEYKLASLDTPHRERQSTFTLTADDFISPPSIRYSDELIANSVAYGLRNTITSTVTIDGVESATVSISIADSIYDGEAREIGGAQGSRNVFGVQRTTIDTSFLSPDDALESATAVLDARIIQRDLYTLVIDAESAGSVQLLDSIRVSYQYASVHSLIATVLVYGINHDITDNTITLKAVQWEQ